MSGAVLWVPVTVALALPCWVYLLAARPAPIGRGRLAWSLAGLTSIATGWMGTGFVQTLVYLKNLKVLRTGQASWQSVWFDALWDNPSYLVPTLLAQAVLFADIR